MFPETPFRTRQVSYLMGAVSVLKTDAEKQNHLSNWLSTHSHLLITFYEGIIRTPITFYEGIQQLSHTFYEGTPTFLTDFKETLPYLMGREFNNQAPILFFKILALDYWNFPFILLYYKGITKKARIRWQEDTPISSLPESEKRRPKRGRTNSKSTKIWLGGKLPEIR